MTKESLRDLKKTVKKSLFGKNLIFSCLTMLLKYTLQAIFFILLTLLLYSVTNLQVVKNFIPAFIIQVNNSFKLLFIAFLCIATFIIYIFKFILTLGINRWYYLLLKDSKTSCFQIFYYCKQKKRFLNAIKLKIYTILNLFLCGIYRLFFPAAVFAVFSIQMQLCQQKYKILFASFMLMSLLIILINIVYFIRKVIILNLYKVIFFNKGLTGFRKNIKKIELTLKRDKLDNFKFLTSLLYCFFSLIFVFPSLISIPYLHMVLYSYMNIVIKKNKEKPLEPKHKLFYIDINQELTI